MFLPQIETIRHLSNPEFPAILGTPTLWYMRVSNLGLIVNGFWGSSAIYDTNPCETILPRNFDR